MSFLDRARQAAEQAAQQARQASARPTDDAADGSVGPTGWVTDGSDGPMSARDIADQARQLGGQARRGLASAVDRIDPGLLADIVIKATALQEKTNLALHAKGSAYRIGEVNITVALPPQISFSIVRVTDLPGDAPEVGYDPRERGQSGSPEGPVQSGREAATDVAGHRDGAAEPSAPG